MSTKEETYKKAVGDLVQRYESKQEVLDSEKGLVDLVARLVELDGLDR